MSIVVIGILPKLLSANTGLFVLGEGLACHILLFLPVKGLVAIYNSILVPIMTDNSSRIVVSQVNMDKLAITHSGTDSEGVACRLLASF